MRHALTLCAILTLTLFSGCAQKECKPVFVPQRCTVPTTPEPVVDNNKCEDDDYSCIIAKALKNYEAQKSYARELRVNSEACR